MINQETMDTLKGFIGQRVTVNEVFWRGDMCLVVSGVLAEVDDFLEIQLSPLSHINGKPTTQPLMTFDFISTAGGVQQIRLMDTDRVAYQNLWVHPGTMVTHWWKFWRFGSASDQQAHNLAYLSFGDRGVQLRYQNEVKRRQQRIRQPSQTA